MEKTKKKKFSHAFTVSFEVNESKHEDWLECMKNEKQKVINCLLDRVAFLMANESEFMEAIEGFDTHEE